MKKLFVLGLGICVAFAFTSCKSSESAYKKAYEKAKQQETTQPATTTPTANDVTPVVAAPVQTNNPSPASAPAQGSARQERVTLVSGSGLQDYSVVCGSFGVKTNADNLKKFLDGEGYNSIVVFNSDNNMYRVIVSSYSDYAAAQEARDAFKAKYPNRSDFQGAWLLYRLN
ncbi:MAG: SPOR domain-containing protein [Bacteroidaceae bacterium]|nr:SPOR domain-containing protein [Bacteroidaceae bacterium]